MLAVAPTPACPAPTRMEQEIAGHLSRASIETLDMVLLCARTPAPPADLVKFCAPQAANMRALLDQAALAVSIVEEDRAR